MKHLLAALCFASSCAFADTSPQAQLDTLEKSFGGEIGVYAVDTGTGKIIAHRADQHFPFQSTLKLIAISDLLKQSNNNPNLLNQNIPYTKKDLMYWCPVTAQHFATGMTLKALAEAAISYSDNLAANLIIKKLGGPKNITTFARAIGNPSFNVAHYEGDLNSNPANTEDTSTPKDMANSLQKLTLGKVLTQAQKTELLTWMQNNTVGYKRIRAGIPGGWVVADKTGTGDYGVANDIGILWSPACKPIILSIYTAQKEKDAKSRDDIIADTTKIVMDSFAKENACFNATSG